MTEKQKEARAFLQKAREEAGWTGIWTGSLRSTGLLIRSMPVGWRRSLVLQKGEEGYLLTNYFINYCNDLK